MTICEICGGTGWVPSAGGPHSLSILKRWCDCCQGVGSVPSRWHNDERHAQKRAEATERALREGWVGMPEMDLVTMAGDGQGRR